MKANNIYDAAILALTSITAGSARLAKKTKLGNYETEERALSEITALIAAVKEAAQSSGMQFGSIQKTDEHREAYDPLWTPDQDSGVGV